MKKISRSFIFVSFSILLLTGGTMGLHAASEGPVSLLDPVIGKKTAQADEHDDLVRQETQQLSEMKEHAVKQIAEEKVDYSMKVMDEKESVSDTENKSDKTGIHEMTNEKADQLLSSFMDKLVQDIDDQYKVSKYDSKEELLDVFGEIATEQLAMKFIDYYYEERNEGLYIVPTELPPWVELEEDYQLEQVKETEWKLTQQNKSELYGIYTIHVTFAFEDGKWLISDVQYE